MSEENQDKAGDRKKGYDKYYRLILIVPAIFLLFSIIYLVQFNASYGEIIRRDVSLTGGTAITVFDETADINELKNSLSSEFPDLLIRALSDPLTGKQQAFFIETKAEPEEIKPALESYLGYKLNNENSSVEFSGATISEGFYKQLRGALIAAFLLMALVIFSIFGRVKRMKAITFIVTGFSLSLVLQNIRLIKSFSVFLILTGLVFGLWKSEKGKKDYLLFISLTILAFILQYFYSPPILLIPLGIILLGIYSFYSVPSIAVILAAFADLAMTLTVVNLLGISLSAAGMVALFMLVGYSVDTDILLTSRVLKRKEGSLNERIFGAFKTGLTMTLTSIIAISVSLIVIYNFSDVLRQIFSILLIGLFFDMFNTWTANASLIKWYAEANRIN